MTDPALAGFIDVSRGYLCDEYPRKIERAVAHLSDEDLWWRPNPESNSVGNLLLHMSGNARQWVVSGLGGRPDIRERSAEFAAEGGSRTEVLTTFRLRMAEVDEVLRALDPERLAERFEIQALPVGGMEALYHAVEHFSMHTGQILWIAKARSGRDLGFYQLDAEGRVTGTDW